MGQQGLFNARLRGNTESESLPSQQQFAVAFCSG